VSKKRNMNSLHKHWPYHYTIDLVEGAQPSFGPIYNLLQVELATLCEYINENLKKGFIWQSKFPIDALILFVKKKDGFLGMCVNYHGLNWLTIKNWYPLPLISSLLDRFNHAKMYTKIDLHGAYNLVCIRKGDEWKMMFKTHYGHFEYIVMPFGLTNAPIVFHLMNNVFCEYLDNFVVCYIDDIFIFSNNMEDRECHVRLVLKKLWEVGLYTKLEKCEFINLKWNSWVMTCLEMTFACIFVTLLELLSFATTWLCVQLTCN
jgi:hypothetical protein